MSSCSELQEAFVMRTLLLYWILEIEISFFPLSQDDIIDDVGDFVAAAEILKERGAYKIYIMATHGLLSADAPRLIEESAIDEVSPPHFTNISGG